jgi:predicted metal-binding membrane protein
MTGLVLTRRRNAPALVAAVGLGAVAWVLALRQMDGMDMGSATELGSVAWFAGAWVTMMAAMMLPGAAPRRAAGAFDRGPRPDRQRLGRRHR